MKPGTIVILTSCLSAVSGSLLPKNPFRNTALSAFLEQIPFGGQSRTMNSESQLTPQSSYDHDAGTGGDGSLTIADILPKSRNINIFASLTRDVSAISRRLDSLKATDNTTLLAPLNSAMQALPRKPWEDRPDDATGISAARNEDKAAHNLERFVVEHVVPSSPWRSGKDNKVRTLGGQEIWWEEREGKRILHPSEVVVDGVVGKVGNGEVWALRGVINYA